MTAAPHYGFTSAPYYGFGTSPSYRFSPSPTYPVRNPVAGPRFNGQVFRAPGFAARGTSGSIARSSIAGENRYRMPYRPSYRRDPRYDRRYRNGSVVLFGWPNTYAVAGYPGFLDYPWDYDESDNSYVSPGYAPQDYNSEPENQQQPEYPEPPAWPSSGAPQNDSQSSAPAPVAVPTQENEPVTLVFNNGRAPVTIHNYLLTRATLYVMDQHRSEIPVAELDLDATAKVNREAGIDFKLPGQSK
jgi:hypothetical protein